MMRCRATIAAAALGLALLGAVADPPNDTLREAPRFAAVHVWLDSDLAPLAAWQVSVTAPLGVAIVGIEGGAHPSYAGAPHFDPAAIGGERVIIAAFDNGAAETLPAGRTRVATIHLRVPAGIEPRLAGEVEAAATVDGRRVRADLNFTQGTLP